MLAKELGTTISPVTIHKVLRGAHFRILVETHVSVDAAIYKIILCALLARCVFIFGEAVIVFFAVLHFFLTSA